jgi:CHASE3 domain sensor protein
MIDKDIVLAFVNGPGASLAFMWAVFLLFLFGLYWTAREYNAATIQRQAKDDAQRGALQNIEQTLRAMKSEQKSEQVAARRLGEGDGL